MLNFLIRGQMLCPLSYGGGLIKRRYPKSCQFNYDPAALA